jgi:hypothetical protein
MGPQQQQAGARLVPESAGSSLSQPARPANQ